MYGSGLLLGLKETLKHFFAPNITQKYPEVMPDLPERSHGFFTFLTDKCIACSLCERACPNDVITLTTGKNAAGKRQVAGYEMDLGYCLFCGLCIEACPTQALLVNETFELSCFHRGGTIYEFFEADKLPQPEVVAATGEEEEA